LSNPDLVNELFAAISTTSAYNYNDATTVLFLRDEPEQSVTQTYVNGYELEPVLPRLKNTAPVPDAIAYLLGFIVIVHLNRQML